MARRSPAFRIVTTPCGATAGTPRTIRLSGSRSKEGSRPGTRPGKPSKASRKKLAPGLDPKTVVNTHRMLHRAWEDFAVWGWAKRNFVNDAPPPRPVRKGR
jgi:hypothetical protein